MRVAEVMPPNPPATKCTHGLRSLMEAGRWVISPVPPSLLFGSTAPSSRDSVNGRGICDAVCWCWGAALREEDVATIQDSRGGRWGVEGDGARAIVQLVRIIGLCIITVA